MGVIYRRYDPSICKYRNAEAAEFNFTNASGGSIIMSIDGSSSRTGIAVIDYINSGLYGTMAVERNDKEDYVEYKIRLKNLLKNFMDAHINVLKHIFYEEPFIGFASATEVLMAIRTTVKEIKIENAPKYDHIAFTEVNNQKWKRIFLRPDKVPAGTDNQKIAVQKKIAASLGAMACEQITVKKTGEVKNKLIFTEDECDAIGLGVACLNVIKTGYDDEELVSKKKPRPFKYNIQYLVVTADDIDAAELIGAESFYDFNKAWNVPQKVIDNGITLATLNGRGAFDNHVFSNMGGDDKLLILTFKAGKYVDAIIKNGRSDLCGDYDGNEYFVAFVWRKTRK